MAYAALIFASGAFYALSFITSLGRSTERGERLVFFFALSGFVLQLVWLAARTVETSSLPVATPYDMLETLVCLLVFFPIMGRIFFNARVTGIFSMFPAAFMTLLPFGCPLFMETLSSGASRQAAEFASVHGFLAALSYAFTMFAATLAAMYFCQKRLLMQKRSTKLSRAIPSLGLLESGMSASLSAAALAMLASVAAGVAAASKVSPGSAMVLKFCLGLGLLIAQVAAFSLAAFGVAKGSRLASLSAGVAIFALLLLFPIAVASWL